MLVLRDLVNSLNINPISGRGGGGLSTLGFFLNISQTV